jgi:hypothetical protein
MHTHVYAHVVVNARSLKKILSHCMSIVKIVKILEKIEGLSCLYISEK